MNISVWTSWGGKNAPKCIFAGQTDIIPRKGDLIVVRKGFMPEKVEEVIFNLAEEFATIRIEANDGLNIYGPCLMTPKKG